MSEASLKVNWVDKCSIKNSKLIFDYFGFLTLHSNIGINLVCLFHSEFEWSVKINNGRIEFFLLISNSWMRKKKIFQTYVQASIEFVRSSVQLEHQRIFRQNLNISTFLWSSELRDDKWVCNLFEIRHQAFILILYPRVRANRPYSTIFDFKLD